MCAAADKKAVGLFLGTEEGIAKAYAPGVKQAICDRLAMVEGCYPHPLFENNELPAAPFAAVEYIFSTWNMPALTGEQIQFYFPNLKAVFYAAGTVRYFAAPYMERGVRIFSAWGANAVPVAEVTVSEIILANKGFFQTLHRGDGPVWRAHDFGKPYPGNYDTPVGIIGAGMIGSLVIRMLKAYRLPVLVFDPFLSDEKAEALGVGKVTHLPELFECCQVISNHLANNPQTENMIDESCFGKMGDNAVFLNTGRGKQVNEAALIAALKQKPTRAAVLDVTWPEPPEAGSELYTLKNVFLTPHMAGSIGSEVQRMGEYMLAEFTACLEGKPTRFEVTPAMLETMA